MPSSQHIYIYITLLTNAFAICIHGFPKPFANFLQNIQQKTEMHVVLRIRRMNNAEARGLKDCKSQPTQYGMSLVKIPIKLDRLWHASTNCILYTAMNVFWGTFWHNVQVLSWFIYGNMIIVKQIRWMIIIGQHMPTWAQACEEEGGNAWQDTLEGRKRQSKRRGSLANNWGLFKLEYHCVPSYHEAFEENNQNRNQRLEK